MIHQHVVDISYSDERLIKEMNDLEEIATRVYKLITEAYGWRMEKGWSRGRPLRSSSRTERKQQGFDCEKAVENMEELVSAMEEGELSLEESLQAFEQGIKLTRECQSALKNAEQKVQILLNENGDTEDLEVEAMDD